MKKLLISLATGIVVDALILYATRQRDTGGTTPEHYDRWITIIGFLQEIKAKGLPL